MVRLKRSAINSFKFYDFIILYYLPKLISLSLYAILRDDWTTVIWNFAIADTVVSTELICQSSFVLLAS